MIDEIRAKLRNEIGKPFESECQVVYILSRIRKLLELYELKDKYPHLNFYCNISLHAKIDQTNKEPIHSILKEFIEKPLLTRKIGFHTEFRSQLNVFLISQKILPLDESKLDDFIFTLGFVISDTPIYIYLDRIKYTIVFMPPKNKFESGLRIISPPYRPH